MKASSTFIVNNSGNKAEIKYFSIVDIDNIEKFATGKISSEKIIYTGNTVDDFIMSLTSKMKVSICYIQDFKFMSRFILSYLMTSEFHKLSDDFDSKLQEYRDSGNTGFGFDGFNYGYNVFADETGEIYKIKIYAQYSNCAKTCEIRSALNKTKSKLIDLYESFDVEKKIKVDKSLIVDETLQRDIVSDDDKFGCMTCSIVLAYIMKILSNNKMTNLTIGTDSQKEWQKLDKENIPLLPEISKELDTKLRHAYTGGFTWCNPKYSNKEIGEGIVLDINSLYPYVMRKFSMPHGDPIYESSMDLDKLYRSFDINSYDYYTNDYKGYYFIMYVHLEAVVKKDHIPSLLGVIAEIGKKVCRMDYATDIPGNYVWITSFDYMLLRENYKIMNIRVEEAYKFETKSHIFDNFIDTNYENKRKATGAKKQISKLKLASLYGRFGLKIDKKKLNIDIDEKSGILKYSPGENFNNKVVHYLPMAIFITSISRYIIIKYAQKCYDRLIYIDTDSLHLIGKDIPKICRVSDNLGDFKVEAAFSRAKYIGLKTYIHDEYSIENPYSSEFKKSSDVHTVVKMCGAVDAVKDQVTWDNFKTGETFTGSKKLKMLPGGAIRIPCNYTITQTI